MSSAFEIFIIANPVSGRGRGRRTGEELARRFEGAGHPVDLFWTSASGDARKRAAEVCASPGNPSRVIVACGGDGTIQEVAGAIAKAGEAGDRTGGDAKATLGLAPSGRCNDFARANGVTVDPSQIFDVIVNGETRALDLGRAGDRYFTSVATLGIDADITSFVDSELRLPIAGTPAYLYGAARILLRYKGRPLRLRGSFGDIEKPIFIASIANTSSYGGAVPIAPHADPEDGLLDLCIIDYMSRLRALPVVPRILRGSHLSHTHVSYHKSERIEVSCDKPVDIWADGELIGQAPTTFEVRRGAIQTRLPKRSKTSDTSRQQAKSL